MPTDTTLPTTWNDALKALDDIEDPPREVLSWASANWDAAATRLVERLGEFAAGRRDRVSAAEAFYIAHLCGEKAETRAFPILCRLIAEDPRIADWLDDAVTETLPGILIRVFDGDAARLRNAIESEAGDAFARASALAALGYLVRARAAMTDGDMRAFLRRLRRDAAPRRESVFWLIWASTAADLGFAGMRAEVADLRREGFIPEGDFSRADFDARVALARSDATGLRAFAFDFVTPLDDATSAILTMAGVQAAQAARRLQALSAGRR
ncbi:uncharacterized protein DUF1186 [Roseiarcus fermentans]|uniref:Uncharacterized protein DUF1186 n=1 Tax=Roseiarcus fermentans TaxID=1473586 RepID=A0A366EVU4_9HYPH|nr:DUF1186 domain-containing protein [Roseiarcus fermentans]RBP06513.1 uncharacterized protein DUF1186 [Roseiarcus fermentans]